MTDATAPNPTAGTVRWTSRAFLLVAFGGGLAVLAVALRSPVPLFAGIPLLVAPFLAGLASRGRLARADLSWEAGGLGPAVTITGLVRGDFGRSATDVSIELPRPFGVSEAEPIRLDRAPDAIRFEVGWTLSEPSIMSLVPPEVVWHDPLGLAERVLGGARPPLSVERYPPSLHRIGAIQLVRTTTLPGDIRSRLLGGSGEFFGLRAAVPGEPPRRINWRASARAGRLLANEYRVDRTGDMVVVLDVRPTSLGPAIDDRLLGIARAAVFGITESFLRNKIRIGFASYGEFLEALPLSTGRVHRLRIQQAVLAARRAEAAGPAERCALGMRRFYPPATSALVVSSWMGDPTFNLVPHVEREGFPAVLLSPSPLPMRAGTGRLDPADEPLATRLEQLERRTRISQLWADGPVVDWDDYWSLEPLARILRRPTYRRVS